MTRTDPAPRVAPPEHRDRTVTRDGSRPSATARALVALGIGVAVVVGLFLVDALAPAIFPDPLPTRAQAGHMSPLTDAARGSDGPFDARIQDLRRHRGQIDVAAALRTLMEGSAIRASHRTGDERLQDPYCLRCQPQVMGACLDVLRQAATTLATEANGVSDNPLVFADSGDVISGGNFHAQPVAFAARFEQ